MDDQISMFPDDKETQFRKDLSDPLSQVLRDNFLPSRVMAFKKNKGYCSLRFQKSGMDQWIVAFRYHFGPRSQWVELPYRSRELIPPGFGKSRILKPGAYTRIYLSSAEEAWDHLDILAASLDITIEAAPREYSCCSRYQECSDAEHCVNPYPEIAAECRYRINLKHGRNFYKKTDTPAEA